MYNHVNIVMLGIFWIHVVDNYWLNLALASQLKNPPTSRLFLHGWAVPNDEDTRCVSQNSSFARQGHALLVRSGSGPGAEILVPHVTWLQVVCFTTTDVKNGTTQKLSGGCRLKEKWGLRRYIWFELVLYHFIS